MQDIISLYEARPERCAGGDGKGQFCHFVINSNLITAVMIDHFFDILTLCGFHLPEAGWRGTRGSGIKWAKSRRRSAWSADRAACLFPSFLLLSGRQWQATQNTIKTQKTIQTT